MIHQIHNCLMCRQPLTSLFVMLFPSSKSLVVDMPSMTELHRKLLLLFCIRIYTVFSGSAELQSYLPFWFSIYAFTVSMDTAPTVDTNLLLVQRQGNRLLREGNSFLNIWAVYPFILATTLNTPTCGFTSNRR